MVHSGCVFGIGYVQIGFAVASPSGTYVEHISLTFANVIEILIDEDVIL